ncbi:MAG TPA: hypothetical protein VK971_02155 [Thiohalobacter sp.]|nr:hypothetical protein [Thiohalobacter sp.]
MQPVYGTSSARTAGSFAAGIEFVETDTGAAYRSLGGGSWVQTRDPSGAALVHMKSSDVSIYGTSLQDDLWGDEVNKAALVNGTGKGPDYFYVDMRQYGRAALAVMLETGSVEQTATIAWSPSGDESGDWHSETTLWSAQAGNQGSAITILDNFARITLTQNTGAAEAVYAYVVGRELA